MNPDKFSPPPKRQPARHNTDKRTVYLGDFLYDDVEQKDEEKAAQAELRLKNMIDCTTRIHVAQGLPKPEFKKLSTLGENSKGCQIPFVDGRTL